MMSWQRAEKAKPGWFITLVLLIGIAVAMSCMGVEHGWADQQPAGALQSPGSSQSLTSDATLDSQAIGKTICVLAEAESGVVSWNEKTRTITMKDATINLDKQSLLITEAILVNAQAEAVTPTITLKLSGKNTIKGEGLKQPITVKYANLKVVGSGSLTIDCPKALLYDIKVQGNFTASSGKLNIIGGVDGILCDGNVLFNGANVSVRNVDGDGIQADGNITVKKGSVSVKSASLNAFLAEGKIRISGGKVVAECVKVSDYVYYALKAEKGVSTKADCLKSVKGLLDEDASFKVNGNTYVVDHERKVILKSYGSSAKTHTVNKVQYGSIVYSVLKIGGNAFNTKRGKALTSLTIGSQVRFIGSKAFYNTANLVKLNVKNFYYFSADMSKTAFSGCGKAGGAKLTVLCPRHLKLSVQNLFTLRGMSKTVTYV